MHYALFIGTLLWFAAIAPLKITLATCLFLLLVMSIVRFSVQAVAGVQSSFGDVAKAVGLSFFFLAIAIYTLVSFSTFTGHRHFTWLGAYAVVVAMPVTQILIPVAYILGFKLGLGVSFGASAIIALISTIASAVAFILFRSLL